MLEQQVNNLVAHLFRHEAGKMAAVLTRLLGFQSLDTAEDIVQETLFKAMSTWPFKGIPENPSAWLYTVAKRKAIDVIRQQKIHEQHHSKINLALKSEWTLIPTVNSFFLENEIEDSQLRMIFACCHPSIPYESQVALTLKTLCGLSIPEIASSFLTSDDTITKRLYRAREKIRFENISLEAPAPAHLPGRLDAVLHSLYLLFNEGYNSSHPDKRSRWFKPLIEKGKYYLEIAAEGDTFCEYHLEAAIAGCHARALSFAETDWQQILRLYDMLMGIAPGPIVQLNKAIATGYAISAEAGLHALQEITDLQHHYLYYSALGDFYATVGDSASASRSYERAIGLTRSKAEKNLLQTKLNKTLEHKL